VSGLHRANTRENTAKTQEVKKEAQPPQR